MTATVRNDTTTGFIYLIHFHEPIGGKHKSQHYLGWAKHLKGRLNHHRKGTSGVKMISNEHGTGFTDRGIGFHLATWWVGDRHLERKLKNRKNHKLLCPICQAQQAAEKEAK